MPDCRYTRAQHLRRVRQYIRHPLLLWWALTNRFKGYQFGPVQRCRRCDHTSPNHYTTCPNVREAD